MKQDETFKEKLERLEKFWKKNPTFRLRKNSLNYRMLIETIKKETKGVKK